MNQLPPEAILTIQGLSVVVMALVGWYVRGVRDEIKEVKNDIKNITQAQHDCQIGLPVTYASRNETKDSLKELFERTGHLEMDVAACKARKGTRV